MGNWRRHLGPGYTEYPAKRIAEFFGDKLFKLVMWLFCCALWSGVYYVIITVVNMCRTSFLEGAKSMTNAELYITPASLCVFGAGCFVLLVIVNKARRGEKKIHQNNPRDRKNVLKRPVK